MPLTIDNEKRKIVLNAISNAVHIGTAIAVTFFVSPLLVHGLGDTRFGVWLLVDSVLAYLALADLGIGASVLVYVARFDGLRDRETINRVFSTSLFLFTCAGVLVFVIVLGMLLLWSRPFEVSDELAHEARWLLLLLGTNLAIGLPLGVYKSVLMGLRRYPTINVMRVSMLLARSGLFILVLRAGGNLQGIAFTIAGCSLLENIGCAWFAHRYLPGLRYSRRFVDRETFRSIRGYSGYVFMGSIAGKVVYQSGPLIIGGFLGATAVTYFGIAATVCGRVGDAIMHVVAVLTPSISNWRALGNDAAIRRLFSNATRYVLYAALPVEIGLVVFGYPFLELWMGPRYAEQCYYTMVVLAIPFWIAISHSIAARILEGIGKVKYLAFLNIFQAIATVGASIPLVGYFGIEGIATGRSVALAAHGAAVTYLVCRIFKVGGWEFAKASCLRPALAASLLGAFWGLISQWQPPSDWSSLISIGVLGVLLYSGIVVAFDPPLRQFLWSMARMPGQCVPRRERAPEAISPLDNE